MLDKNKNLWWEQYKDFKREKQATLYFDEDATLDLFKLEKFTFDTYLWVKWCKIKDSTLQSGCSRTTYSLSPTGKKTMYELVDKKMGKGKGGAMEITVALLKKWEACKEGVEWFGKKSMALEKLILKLQSEKRYDWIWWTMCHTLDKTQFVKVVIYAAESVIDIFEAKYPKDKRPREAIEAAKAWLKNPCNETEAAAAWAAAYSTKADLIVGYYIKILKAEKAKEAK